MQLLIKL